MLTSLGQSQARKLGANLAEIYMNAFKDVGYLKSVPSEKNIYLRSTDVPRTIETVQFVIEGFFPNNSAHIPIHVRPALVDSLYMRFDQKDISRSRSRKYQEYLEHSKKLKWELDRITDSDLEVNHYHDQFRCRECHGQSYICGKNECISQSTKNQVYQMAEWWSRFEFDISQREEFKMRMSDILEEIFDNANHDDYLLRFYSVHDTNLMPLLSLFSTDNHYWPPYISSLIIESWVQNDQILTRLIYNGQDPFEELPHPQIRWVDPRKLIPHEHTSAPHLQNLIEHLQTLPFEELVPIPVITLSAPRVILDGHHRVAAALFLEIDYIPCWTVDEEEEERNWDQTRIRVYSGTDGSRMKLKDVITSARDGKIDYGIKGTRHVAVVGVEKAERQLDKVTPRIKWGQWISGGKDFLENSHPVLYLRD